MSDSQKSQKNYCKVPAKQTITSPPKPDFKLTEFLAWLKKRGGTWTLEVCRKKCTFENFDLESALKKIDNEKIGIFMSKGKKYVVLRNKDGLINDGTL